MEQHNLSFARAGAGHTWNQSQPDSNETLDGGCSGSELAETLATVRFIIAARRTREAIIGDELFADPAWDILLELYAAALVQTKVATSDLCKASAVPATTALRWIDRLESAGLLQRQGDPLDARRTAIELTHKGELKMESYFRIVRSGLRLA